MEKSDIHFNALNYSVKKDGTSGGIAFVTALDITSFFSRGKL